MSYYDYDKFVHLVPAGHIIPKGTPTRSVQTAPPVETFFTAQNDASVDDSDVVKYYLTYDITRPKLPEEVNSVIYNANVSGTVYPVAVYQGMNTWSAFSVIGNRKVIYTPEIESFDTTPPEEEAAAPLIAAQAKAEAWDEGAGREKTLAQEPTAAEIEAGKVVMESAGLKVFDGHLPGLSEHLARKVLTAARAAKIEQGGQP